MSDTSNAVFFAIDKGANIVPDPALKNIKPTNLGNRRDNPAKIGDTLVSGSWVFKIVEAIRGDKAAELAQKASIYNEPAPEGQEYVAVRVTARYLGSDQPDHAERAENFRLKITGEKNVIYKSPLAVAPSPRLLGAELFAGGETDGWVILSVSKGEKGLLVIFESPGSSDDARYIAIP